jgi:hypothetical protein
MEGRIFSTWKWANRRFIKPSFQVNLMIAVTRLHASRSIRARNAPALLLAAGGTGSMG